MDPLSIATAVVGLIGGIYTVTNAGRGIKNCLANASKEFRRFQVEVNNFRQVWEAVEYYLDPQQDIVSDVVRDGLVVIRHDTTSLLRNFDTFIRQLIEDDKRATIKRRHDLENGRAFPGSLDYEGQSEKRFKIFWNRDEIRQQRLELQHAYSTVQAVLAIINIRTKISRPAQERQEAVKQAELAIEERRVSLSRLQNEEQSNKGKYRATIQAETWLPHYPDPEMTDSPVAEIARLWLSPGPDTSKSMEPSSFHGNEAAEDIIDVPRPRSPAYHVAPHAQLTSAKQHPYGRNKAGLRPQAAVLKAHVYNKSYIDLKQQRVKLEAGVRYTAEIDSAEGPTLHQERMMESLRKSELELKASQTKEARLSSDVDKLKEENNGLRHWKNDFTFETQKDMQTMHIRMDGLEQDRDTARKDASMEQDARRAVTEQLHQMQIEHRETTQRLRGERNQARHQYEKGQALLEGAQRQQETIRSQWEDLQVEMREIVATVQASPAVRQQNAQLRNDLQQQQVQIQDLQSQAQAHHTRLQTLEDEKRTLETRLELLEGEKQALETRIHQLELENERLHTINVDLQAENARLRSEDQRQTEGHAQELERQLRPLQGTARRLREERDALRRRIDQLREASRQERTQHETELQGLRREHLRERADWRYNANKPPQASVHRRRHHEEEDERRNRTKRPKYDERESRRPSFLQRVSAKVF